MAYATKTLKKTPKDISDRFDRYDSYKKQMTLSKAKELLGDRATWELKNMRKALRVAPFLNTDEEEERRVAVDVLLKN